jgi:hypothetical protein
VILVVKKLRNKFKALKISVKHGNTSSDWNIESMLLSQKRMSKRKSVIYLESAMTARKW